jgi:hypothetical protein
MKYRISIELCGVFRRHSRWYDTEGEVLSHLNEFLKAHKGLTYSIRLEEGTPSSTDIGF